MSKRASGKEPCHVWEVIWYLHGKFDALGNSSIYDFDHVHSDVLALTGGVSSIRIAKKARQPQT
jgi:hypothetical protein